MDRSQNKQLLRKVIIAFTLFITVLVLIGLSVETNGDVDVPVVAITAVGFTNRYGRADGTLLMLSNASNVNLVRSPSYTVDASEASGPPNVQSFLITSPSLVLKPKQVEIVDTQFPDKGDRWVVSFGFQQEVPTTKKSFYYFNVILGKTSNAQAPLNVYLSPGISRPAQ